MVRLHTNQFKYIIHAFPKDTSLQRHRNSYSNYPLACNKNNSNNTAQCTVLRATILFSIRSAVFRYNENVRWR